MQHDFQKYNRFHDHRERRMRGRGDKTFFGMLIILAGVFILVKKLHLFYIDWQLVWPIVLIGIGLLLGIKKRFHNHAWWILMMIGVVHLIPEFEINGVSSASLITPAALIIGGLVIVFRSKTKKDCLPGKQFETVTNSESVVNIDVTFAGRKEIVTSKDFKGGNIHTSFGGVELNLVQADTTTQPIVLNVKVSFGGVELIVPSHWEIQNEIETTLGSVEDHRAIRTGASSIEERKVLVLRGSCSFGSLEIKSY
ncbi:MAG: hypothetical protein EOP51_01020 [Sphingobacteriales bacterium]|nr:MAG: hypothetical protein EOP51_01020 [Sphingobacteriales bacterium]